MKSHKMGFDLYILVQCMIDETTGLPIVYKNMEKHTYVPEEYQVCEEYRKFICQRGNWFSNYILYFEGNQVSVDRFLDHYPDWEDVINDWSNIGEDWTKKDHDDFKQALSWFAEKGIFQVSWSY